MQPLQCSHNYSRKLTIPSLGLVLVLLITLASPTSSCTEHEKACLIKFLAGLSKDGGLTATWQDGTDCCKWEGITCSPDRTVTAILLASKGLEGHISQSLGNLTGLQHLNLSHNSLHGGLPLELLSSSSISVLDVSFNQLNGALQELPSLTPARPLQVLNISSNLFAGQFPSTTWEVMNSLVALNASNNSFTGNIPTQFCNSSPSFSMLQLCYNQFGGSIPPELGRCSMLRVLKIGHSNLSGTLPDELFDATLLEYLSLSNNYLYGLLDGARIIHLRNLVTLDLGGNYFSSNIPFSIGELKRLEELHFDNNNMSGELPSSMSNCTNLRIIDLKNNYFSGELNKVNFSSLPKLKTLDLLQNNFIGEIPESIYSCSNLIALRLSSNMFHGPLSERIGNLKSLSFLSLVDNSLTNITSVLQILGSSRNLTTLLIGFNFLNETMPDDDSIDGFKNLQVLALDCSSLLGKIPHWLSKLTNLEMLVLNDNQLTGTIPDWISSLNLLFYVDISNNRLTEEIPTSLVQMPMLRSKKIAAYLDPRGFELPMYVGRFQYSIFSAFPKVLGLNNNKFTGEIPQEIGHLKGLLSLNFSFNNLTGQIPQSICNLTDLLLLDLSNNNLAGAIPAALNYLHFLSIFNVSNNDLEGPIPTGGQFGTFQNFSFDGNPKLCGPILARKCDPSEEPTDRSQPIVNNQITCTVVFVIAFSAFFGVGVLYVQIVLSRYFG